MHTFTYIHTHIHTIKLYHNSTEPTTAWGGLPQLTLSDGQVIGQQRAILRVVGKAAGLYPEDGLAAARVDEFLDGT
jgi:hypothetical protein